MIDGEHDVTLTLARYLCTQNNKIVLFGSDGQKRRAVGQDVHDVTYVVGNVSDQDSIQKLYDYFGKGFQAIDVIVQVTSTCKAGMEGLGGHENRSDVKGVKGSTVNATNEWNGNFISPENLQEYFIRIMLREREAQVITIFREYKKRNSWFILPYLRVESYSHLYSRRLRQILSKTHIKVTDVFMPESNVSESGLKKMIEAAERGKHSVYL